MCNLKIDIFTLKNENTKMYIEEMRLKALQANLVQRESNLAKREAILEKREAIFEKREAILEKREAILAKRETKLETEFSERGRKINLEKKLLAEKYAILQTIERKELDVNPVPEPCDYKQTLKTMWQVQLSGAFGLGGVPVCDQVIQAMEELDKTERVLFISYSYYTVRQAQPNDPFQNLCTFVALDHVYAVTSKALYVLEWATGYNAFGQVRLYGLSLPPQVRFRMNKCIDIARVNWKAVELYVKHTNGIIHAQCPSTNIQYCFQQFL